MRGQADPWEMTVLLESLKRHRVVACNGGSQDEKGGTSRKQVWCPPDSQEFPISNSDRLAADHSLPFDSLARIAGLTLSFVRRAGESVPVLSQR